MDTTNINLSVYPRTFINSSYHSELRNKLASIIRDTLTHLNIPIIDIFMLTTPFHNHNAGKNSERVVIFINGTRNTGNANEPTVLDTNTTLFGIESTFTDFLPPSGDGIIIESDEGIPVAEWLDDTWELNILFDLFDSSTNLNSKLDIFTHIMKAFNEQVWYQKITENSWKYSSQRDKLYNTFYSLLKHKREETLAYDKRQIQQLERDLSTYQTALKHAHDQLFLKRQQVENGENYLNETLSTLEKDLNILIQNEKITDVHINNEFITIFTIPLRIYASNDRIYQGGAYTIKINMFTSEIFFDSDCKHRSYWSPRDPHPHIDGITKKACFGNIESTIAELCSQIQLYALTTILIDFLESANTADAAGACVTNWQEIDEKGNPINHRNNEGNSEHNEDYCYRCGAVYYIEDLYEVYEEVQMQGDTAIPLYVRFVCEDCLDNYYHWSDELEVYLSNDADYDN